MRVLTVIIYSGFLILIGLTLIGFVTAFSFDMIRIQDVQGIMLNLKQDLISRIILILSGIVIILISYIFAHVILNRFQKEKNIAFVHTPGEVATISLSAVEDILKQSVASIPEIKEIRPDIIATKKEMIVNLRVILRTETNLHDLTDKLRLLIMSQIRDGLGLKEEVIINTHIAKIISREEKEKRKKEVEQKEPTVPFTHFGGV